MAKYVGNSQYDRPKRDFSEKLAIASEGVAKGIESYGKIKQAELAQKTLADPNSTSIQKAMALANLGQEKLGTEIFKKSADNETLSGIETRLRQNLGVNPAEPTRDRSWRPEIAQQETTAQPGAEGTGSPSQPGFSVNGPQNAARNPTALNQQAPNVDMNAGVPQGAPMPQGQQQQVDPKREAAAYEQAAHEAARAGNHPVATQYANKAKEVKKDIRQDKKFEHDIIRESIKDEQDIRKESAPYIEGVLNGYKGKKNTEAILNQMEELASSQKLTTPLMNSLLGAAGLPLGVLNNPDSEEFEKLSNNLTRDITKFYGARINQTEFVNFLKQIPTLNNSEEGRLRVVRNLKKMLNPIELEYKIMSDMMAKNGGKPFPNMNFHVTQAMEPTLDKWANEINHDMKEIKDVSTPLASNEVVMVFPDGSRKRVPKEEVGKWSQWGKLE
jgi:hypothetical protein